MYSRFRTWTDDGAWDKILTALIAEDLVDETNRESIHSFLEKNGVRYSYMGKYFGARPTELSLYSPEGYLDFEKVAQSERFNIGVENVILGLESGRIMKYNIMS